MKTLTPREQVGQGMEQLFYDWPLFANIAASWEIVERSDVQTMATDGKRLFYSPDFVRDLTIAEIAWVLLHEAGHCWLGHHLRLTGAERESANVAFDLALNSIIRERAPSDKLRKLMLAPGFGSYAKLPPGQDAEFYHKTLNPPPAPQPQQDQSGDTGESNDSGDQSHDNQDSGDSGEQDQSGESDGEQSQDEQGEQGESESQSESQSGNTDEQSGESSDSGEDQDQGSENGQNSSAARGSASGEQSGGNTTAKNAPGAPTGQTGANKGCPENGQNEGSMSKPMGIGGVLPMPDCDTPAERAEAEGQWQQVVAESMAVGQMCGKLPGWLKDIGEKMLGKAEVDWRTILRRFLTKTVPTGSTYNRPSRRHSWRKDVILPAHRSKGSGDLLIIADVSGSIYSRIQSVVFPEIQRMLRTIPRASVTLMQIDTSIRSEEKFDSYTPLKLSIQGGGGTDLDCGFEKASTERNKYKAVICVTDLYWSVESAPDPKLPTLWIVVGSTRGKDKIPFGEVVHVV